MQQVVEYQLFRLRVLLKQVEIVSASLTLIFFLALGIVKKLLNITRNKKKNMLKFLCWLKVN